MDEVPLNATLSPLRYKITFFEHTKDFGAKEGQATFLSVIPLYCIIPLYLEGKINISTTTIPLVSGV